MSPFAMTDADPKWVANFVEVFALCGVQPGDACAILSETPSRPVLPRMAELALAQLGARWFHLRLPTPRQSAPVPVRSTGASDAIRHLGPVVAALASSVFVADCTVEGLQHAAELPEILKSGARVLAISNEHPEILERCMPRAEDEAPVRDAMRRLKGAREMRVSSLAGNFLYSTGANEVAGRHTLGHFDLPLRGCTVTLDGMAVVDNGVLV